MTSDKSNVEVLEQALIEVRQEVASLRSALSVATRRTSASLRESLRCPACGGTSILHAPQVLDRAEGGAREALALAQPSAWRSRTVGHLEVYFCKRCGLAEWYVTDAAKIEADGDKIRELDGSRGPGESGYRG